MPLELDPKKVHQQIKGIKENASVNFAAARRNKKFLLAVNKEIPPNQIQKQLVTAFGQPKPDGIWSGTVTRSVENSLIFDVESGKAPNDLTLGLKQWSKENPLPLSIAISTSGSKNDSDKSLASGEETSPEDDPAVDPPQPAGFFNPKRIRNAIKMADNKPVNFGFGAGEEGNQLLVDAKINGNRLVRLIKQQTGVKRGACGSLTRNGNLVELSCEYITSGLKLTKLVRTSLQDLGMASYQVRILLPSGTAEVEETKENDVVPLPVPAPDTRSPELQSAIDKRLLTSEELERKLGHRPKKDRKLGLFTRKKSPRYKQLETALNDFHSITDIPLEQFTQDLRENLNEKLRDVITAAETYRKKYDGKTASGKAQVAVLDGLIAEAQKLHDDKSLDAIMTDPGFDSVKNRITLDQAFIVKQHGIPFADCDFDHHNDQFLDRNASRDSADSGAINSVDKLVYPDGTYFFKPEQEKAPDIPSDLAISLNIDDKDPRYGNRNIASQFITEALGLSQVPKSKFVFHNDRIGLLMEEAQGHPPYSDTPIDPTDRPQYDALKQRSQTLNDKLADAVNRWNAHELSDNDLLKMGYVRVNRNWRPDTGITDKIDEYYKAIKDPDSLLAPLNDWLPAIGFKKTGGKWMLIADKRKMTPPWPLGTPPSEDQQAALHKQLNGLEWGDIVTGQGDRHPFNYFVKMDENGVNVTGIDNDFSFGKNESDIPGPAEGGKGLHGYNGTGAPRLIDQATFFKLTQLYNNFEQEIRPKLSTLLTPEEIEATAERIEKLAQHALSLRRDGFLVEDWKTWRSPDAEHKTASEYLAGLDENSNLFRRDFSQMFRDEGLIA